jgi:predicted phage terminase large subunit-like protein
LLAGFARMAGTGSSLRHLESTPLAHDFRAFVSAAWHVIEPATPFVPGFHLDAICEHLEAVSRGEIRNLLITIPPRMSKSTLISVMWPAWEWTYAPERRYLTASYAATLAVRDAVKTRRLLASPWYQDRWGDAFRMAGDQNLKQRYENDKGGYRIATSVGGSATGEGGDVVCCDDPLSAMQAESETMRESALDWWDVTMSTRLNDPKKGARVVVQQRLHERDLAGHLLAQGGYEHLNLPMEYEPTKRVTSIGWSDPRTEPGELLTPERFGPAQVIDMKLRLGARAYAGQMQQRPAPAEGDILKRQWWRFWRRAGTDLPPVRVAMADGRVVECPVIDLPRSFDRQAQSWDMTFRETKSGSYVVGQVWAAEGARRFLLDQSRARLGFSDACAAVVRLSEQWPEATAKYIENKANGPAVVNALRDKIGGFVEVQPDGGKEARANAIQPDIEGGDVYLPHPEQAPWVWDFIEECAAFPNGATDDQVDTMSQALTKMRKRKPIVAFDLSGMERANPLGGMG